MLIKIYKKLINIFAGLTVLTFVLNNAFAIQEAGGIQAPFSDMNGLIATILSLARWFELIVIVFAVIFILIGAFKYISAGGSADDRKEAQSYLTYGIVGIIVAAAAEGIVRAVAWIFGVNLNAQ